MRSGSAGRLMPASATQNPRRTPQRRAAGAAAPSAKAGRTAAAAGVFNTSVVVQTNAPARRKAVLSVCVPEQCQHLTWVLATEENGLTWQLGKYIWSMRSLGPPALPQQRA